MTEEELQILKQAHEAMGPNPTLAQLHQYNELARQLRSQAEWEA